MLYPKIPDLFLPDLQEYIRFLQEDAKKATD